MSKIQKKGEIMFCLIRILCAVLICLFLASSPVSATVGQSAGNPAGNAAVSKVSGKIINYGLVESQDEQKYVIPESGGEKGIVLEEPQISKTTTKIPMKKGAKFGYQWQMSGLPSDQPVEILYRYKHPPMVDANGNRTQGYDRAITLQPENGKIDSFDGYELSEDYELVPGNWTLSILYEGKEIASKTFQVVGGKK